MQQPLLLLKRCVLFNQDKFGTGHESSFICRVEIEGDGALGYGCGDRRTGHCCRNGFPFATGPSRRIQRIQKLRFRHFGYRAEFHDSLIAFARANYALRLEDGRCTAADLDGCRGHYYDPHNMYTEPSPEAELDYNGSPLTYDGSIPASFGMDFVEVGLNRGLNGQPVTITFQSEGARFNVEIWKLAGGGADSQAGTLLSKLGGTSAHT